MESDYSEYVARYSSSSLLSADTQSTNVFDAFKFGAISFEALKNELAEYLLLPLSPSNVNAVQWWIDNAGRFPILSHLALDILAIPTTSVEPERVFSG